MNVPAQVFRKLYELVVKKMLEEFANHDTGEYDAETSRVWTRRFKEPHPSQKIEFKNRYGELYGDTFISQALFGMDAKGTYFYLAYTINEQNFGDVNIKFDRLYKALLYLKYEQPLSVEQITSFQSVPKEKMRAEASTLLDEFITLKCSEIVNSPESKIENVAADKAFEDLLLSSDFAKVKPKIIVDLVNQFFEFLNEHDFYKAWKLLSPTLQKKSVWDGDFIRFRCGWMTMDDIAVSEIYGFSYEFGRIKFFIRYIEEGAIIDLQEMVEEKENIEVEENDMLFEYAIKDRQIVHEVIQILEEDYDIDFYSLSKQELSDLKFQKLFFGLFSLDSAWHYTPRGNYKKLFDTSFTCVHFEEQDWLIDDLGALEPSPFKEFNSVYNLPIS